MTDEQAADNAQSSVPADAPADAPADVPADASAGWAPWLAWGWVALVFLVAIAELTGWDDLRLALDLQRLFR